MSKNMVHFLFYSSSQPPSPNFLICLKLSRCMNAGQSVFLLSFLPGSIHSHCEGNLGGAIRHFRGFQSPPPSSHNQNLTRSTTKRWQAAKTGNIISWNNLSSFQMNLTVDISLHVEPWLSGNDRTLWTLPTSSTEASIIKVIFQTYFYQEEHASETGVQGYKRSNFSSFRRASISWKGFHTDRGQER